MLKDQLVGLDDESKINPLPHPAWTPVPERRGLVGFARVWRGRSKRRSLDHFSDHMLADIGLRRDALRGQRPSQPWLPFQHPR